MTEKKRLNEMGPGGSCICSICETKLPHHEGERCQDQPCPTCGVKMLREGSRQHQQWLEKNTEGCKADTCQVNVMGFA